MANGVLENSNLIPEIWSAKMYDELRVNLPIASFFSREYEGDLRFGDTVKVNQIVAANGEILTDDKAEFSTENMTINQFNIVVNKRASASFEFTDLAQLQSMSFQQMATEALVFGLSKKVEDDVIAALLPSTSAPDHDIAPASAGVLAAADVAGIRTLLSIAKVPTSNRALFLSPSYYGDLLGATTLTSSDYITAGSPVMSGGFNFPLYGFSIVEANNLGTDVGYGVHNSALQMIIQKGVSVKISDLHANKKYAYLLSADMVYGFSLFDSKRIVKISG